MDKKMFIFCLFVLAAILVIPTVIFAASFDCAKAKTKTEKSICGDSMLSQLDNELSVAYGNALKTDDRNEIKKSQRRWLKETLAPCIDDKVCIQKAYENRLSQLNAIAKSSEVTSTSNTEYLLTQQEFVQWKDAAKKVMDVALTDYNNSISLQQRSHLISEQRQWTACETKRCAKAKDFELRQECLATAYNKRAKDIDARLVVELKKQHVAFNYPKFPVNLSDGEFQMDTLGDGKYSFSFLIHGGNGHECGGSGVANWNGDYFTRVPDSIEKIREDYPAVTDTGMPELDELNKSCSLDITFSPHVVIISGSGECHEYFACGMRTSVYGEFQRNDFRVLRKH